MNEPDVQVGLSEREKEVLFLAGDGLTDKEIALRLDIGQKTVRTYWDRMRAKLGAASRTEVLAKAVQTALDAVAESEKRLRVFVDNMPVMFTAFDEDHKIILVNKECERLSGYSAAQYYDGTVFERSLPNEDTRAEVLGRFQEHIGDFRNHEVEITCADGTKKVIAWSSRAKEAPVQGWATWSIGIDVTDRVRAQKSLEETEANFRRILESTSQGVWMVDTQHRTFFANKALADMFACSVQDILSNDESTFLDDASRQSLRELIATGPIGGTRTRFTFRFKRKDGVDLWAYVDTAPIFDLEGDLYGHAAILTDISRSKALEQATGLMRHIVEHLLKESDVSFIRFDRQMSVVEANGPAMQSLLGKVGEELNQELGPFQTWTESFEHSFNQLETMHFEGTVGSGDKGKRYAVTLMPEPTGQQRVGYVLAFLKPVE